MGLGSKRLQDGPGPWGVNLQSLASAWALCQGSVLRRDIEGVLSYALAHLLLTTSLGEIHYDDDMIPISQMRKMRPRELK